MTTMHKISWNNFLASMQEVGHRDYIETDLDGGDVLWLLERMKLRLLNVESSE